MQGHAADDGDTLADFEFIVRHGMGGWKPPPPPEYEAWRDREYAAWLARKHELALNRLGPSFDGQWGHRLPIAETEWIVEGLIPLRSCVIWYGYRSSGKSFLSIHLAYSAALGRDFLGYSIPERVGSVLFSGEKNTAYPKRIKALVKDNGLEGVDLPVMVVPSTPDLTSPRSVSDTIAYLKIIKSQMAALGVPLRLVFLDTLARCLPGRSVIDPVAAMTVLDAITRIVEETGVTVIPLAHVSKGVSVQDSSAKGAGEWEDAAETVFRIERSKGVRALVNTKQSDAAEASPLAFQLRSVDLGHDAHGHPIASCVVEPATFQPQAPRPPKQHPDAATLLGVLRTMLSEPTSGGKARSSISLRTFRDRVLATGYRADVKPVPSESAALKAWTDRTRKALDRAIASLVRSGAVVVSGEEVALPGE